VAFFTGRVLKKLDSIWRFVGEIQGSTDMALEGEIQVVEDLSRIAELGSGLGGSDGYFTRQDTAAHVGAGAIRDTLDPWEFVDVFEPNRERASVWVIGASATLTNTNVDEVGMSISIPAVGDGSLAAREIILAYFDGEVPTAITAAGVFPMVNLGAVASGQGGGGIFTQLPFWVPDGSIFNFMSNASGAGTSVATLFCWAGAAGARPPGLA